MNIISNLFPGSVNKSGLAKSSEKNSATPHIETTAAIAEPVDMTEIPSGGY